LGAHCLPVALNSGLFWPRRSWWRYPGTIRVEALEPIPPGMSKDTFFAQLQDVIETTTARLIMEGEHELASKGIVRQ
jgi:1-acyl-sn-glycerol-3-phosphate acyltransferase